MSQPAARASARTTALLLGAFFLPICVTYAILYRTAIAIPLLDDYDNPLAFSLRLQQLHGFVPRLLACLTDQRAEYKFIGLDLFTALQLGLTGHLSLRLTTLLGDLLLLPILFVFAKNLFPRQTGHRRLLLLLPLPYLVLQLTYAEVLNWTLGSLTALAVVSFVLLSFHLLVRPSPPRAALACVALALACASATNAFLAVPLGAALLLWQRRWLALLAWCATAASMLLIYLVGYHPVPHPPGPPFSARALFLLSFLGGAVENMHHRPVPAAAILLGVLLLATVVHATVSGYARSHPVLLGVALWTVLTALTVASFRASMGLAQSLSGRYKLYCMLLLVFAYGYLADRVRQAPNLLPIRKKLLWRVALTCAILFYGAGTYLGAQFLARRHDDLVIGLRGYLTDPNHTSPIVQPGDNRDSPPQDDPARRTLQAAIAHGIYRIPPLPSVPTAR